MKNIFLSFTFLCILSLNIFAQFPHAINFQAIARDANGTVMSATPIQIRLTVIDGSATGTDVYQELRALTTNDYGSFSFQIGRNPNYVTAGNFDEIDWNSGAKFLKIDYDPTNQFSWNLTLGTIEFVSVPFALSAESVSFIDATNAKNGDVLVYNSTTGKFEPKAISSTGGGTSYTAGAGISIADNVITNTGDISSTNEIQTLNLAGTTLSLSNGGGTVTLPSGTGTSQWTTLGSDIYYSGGNVGIGTSSPGAKMELLVPNISKTPLLYFTTGVIGTGDIAGFQYGDANSQTSFILNTNIQGHFARAFCINGGNVGIGTSNPTTQLQVVGLPEYADNTTAKNAGLTIGAFYRTGDILKVVH